MEEVSKVIKKIQNSLSSLDRVISIINSNRWLLSEFGINFKQEDIDKLSKVREDLEFYRKKLEKDIIEVAFVGLEKAGKSSLVNAIISKDILPSDFKRATYTTTQIEYSQNPSVEITFYSEEEFLKEVFRKMLKDVDYPSYEIQTLDTVSVEDFQKHYESLKDEKRQMYESSLKNDIIEILEGKTQIKELLGRGRIQASFTDFQQYKEYITDNHKSRAVKEVKILTDMLKDLENIIIYDLPGFDSPTLIHSKFTKEKIKRADVVVFVRRADSPSIRKPEVEIIQETKEDDGVTLAEKTFYFCNRADEIKNIDGLHRVERYFIDELKKYGIFQNEDRIIYGSALARLQSIGEVEGDDALKGIEKLGLSDGIQRLLDKIKEYNQNERRKVILRRIENSIGKIKEFGETIYESIEDMLTKSIPMQSYTLDVLRIVENSTKDIKSGLEDFRREVKEKEILQKKEISERIKESISKSISPEALLKEEDKDSIIKQAEMGTSTLEPRPDAFNRKLREKLYNDIRKSYRSDINQQVEACFKEIKDEIDQIFIKALGIKPDKKDKFLQVLESFFKQKNIDLSSQNFSLDILIERFGGDIIQLLIGNPLTSTDRKNKFKEIERELYSLLAYHKDFNPNTKPSELKVVRKIMYQENSSYTNMPSPEEIERYLKDIVLEKDISLSKKEYEDILSLLSESSNPIGILKEAKENKYIDDFSSLKSYINDSISVEKEKEEKSNKFSLKGPENYDEVVEEVRVDIQNLRDFMVDCVINAINIEKMIINQTTSYIDELKQTLDTLDYKEFIANNISYIRPELEENSTKLLTKQEVLRRLKDELERILRKGE